MRSLLLLAALFLLAPAGVASASFDGSNGKVAYVDRENGLFIDDPWDEQPAQGPLATVGSSDVEEQVQAHAHPPAWSPDGTLLAYTAPVADTYKRHSAVFVMKADGTGARQVSHPFPFKPDECEGPVRRRARVVGHAADVDAAGRCGVRPLRRHG